MVLLEIQAKLGLLGLKDLKDSEEIRVYRVFLAFKEFLEHKAILVLREQMVSKAPLGP